MFSWTPSKYTSASIVLLRHPSFLRTEEHFKNYLNDDKKYSNLINLMRKFQNPESHQDFENVSYSDASISQKLNSLMFLEKYYDKIQSLL